MSRKRSKTRAHVHKIHRRSPPGAPPGTLVVDPSAPKSLVSVLAYGPVALLEKRVDDLDELRAIRSRHRITWVNVDGLGDQQAILEIGKAFGLHRLALEDVINVHQRPKIDEYGEDLYIVLRMPELLDRLHSEQISIFLGEGFVVTFDEYPGDCWEAVRNRIRSSRGRIRDLGPDHLVYALVDAIVDAYFPILERYGELLEGLEDDLVFRPNEATVGPIHNAKRDLLMLRRAVWPLRDALNILAREQKTTIQEETRLYFRDCYDHTIQLIDLIETYRELGSSLLEMYLSSISNRTNEVMKVLTIMSTIFIPLTFIAGVYGMNFEPSASPWSMPELRTYWGYPVTMAIMAMIAVGLVVYFYRKGWLRRPSRGTNLTTGSDSDDAGRQP